MKNYTSNEFLKIAEYDEKLDVYFIEADGEDITITVNEGDVYRNYGMCGDKSGSIFVDGSGESSVFRYGPGEGSAYRYGSGDGSAFRYGSGKGSAFIDGIEINRENKK